MHASGCLDVSASKQAPYWILAPCTCRIFSPGQIGKHSQKNILYTEQCGLKASITPKSTSAGNESSQGAPGCCRDITRPQGHRYSSLQIQAASALLAIETEGTSGCAICLKGHDRTPLDLTPLWKLIIPSENILFRQRCCGLPPLWLLRVQRLQIQHCSQQEVPQPHVRLQGHEK